MEFYEANVGKILEALKFSAEKHGSQTRKGETRPPYIHHPIEVAELLWRVGEVRDVSVLVAGLLHDTLEDTNTTPEEIRDRFGEEVLSRVQEVTDDKSLRKQDRKRLQIKHAPSLSPGAKQIKLADKCCNVREIKDDPPVDWSLERKQEYLNWAEQVVIGLRGTHPGLETLFDVLLRDAWDKLE